MGNMENTIPRKKENQLIMGTEGDPPNANHPKK